MADRTAKPSADEAAYNFALVAYKHGLDEDTYTDCLLKVRNIGRNSLETETTKRTRIEVPNLVPNEAELDIPDSFANVVLWVGMRPKDAERYQAKQSRKTVAATEDSEQQPESPTPGASAALKKIGQSVSNIETPTVVESDSEALRVVLELKRGSGQRQFFVLVNPDANGLCDTFKIKKESVFFFKQFRDDNQGVVENRRTGWPKLAQQHVDRVLNVDLETTTKKKFASQDIAVSAPMNLATDLALLAILYDNTSRNGERVGPLQQIKDLLLSVDKGDARYAPPVQNTALYTILTISKPFTEDHAKQAKEEIETMWPALKQSEITIKDMVSLGNALRAANLTIEYRLVRCFLVLFVDNLHSLAQHPDQDTCIFWAKEAHTLARRAVGSADTKPLTVKNRDFITYVDALAHTMKSLLKRIDLHTQALRKSQGDDVVPHDLGSIWERFKAKPDLESAIVAASSYHKYNVAQIMLRDNEVSEGLKKIVAQLEEMSVGLKELDDQADN